MRTLSSDFGGSEVIRFDNFAASDEQKFDGFVLTGSNDHLSSATRPKYKNEIELLKHAKVPVLGICFGHQLLCSAYGSKVARANKELNDYHPVKILKKDPLFNGFKKRIVVKEEHMDEVKTVPKNFFHICTSNICQVEAVKHKSRPLYGVQFHPEINSESFPDGRNIILN
ncbi:MAG: gamma-glutamyl-gamma-aminobutyrate hydrolase family protein, partial [Candidatus Bathyarchaeia archaeon]